MTTFEKESGGSKGCVPPQIMVQECESSLRPVLLQSMSVGHGQRHQVLGLEVT